jgi:hypothetical protein
MEQILFAIMTKKTKDHQSTYVRVERVSKPGSRREVWRISDSGRILNLTTSPSSTTIMDEAVKIYRPALERLAKR